MMTIDAIRLKFTRPTGFTESTLIVRNGVFILITIPSPAATYLVWLDCRELGMSNEELSRFMVEKAGLGLSDGYTFGRSLSGYMRLNAACPRSVLKQALEQLRAAVEAL